MRLRFKSEPNVGVVGYGHLGDSNLHLNIHSPTYDKRIHSLIEPWLFERIFEDRGSISAEHGLGQAKARYLSYSKSPESIDLMYKIKGIFDPNGILNPYKVLPSNTESPN
jgi:FAD/FMN-containing dehydrogenase